MSVSVPPTMPRRRTRGTRRLKLATGIMDLVCVVAPAAATSSPAFAQAARFATAPTMPAHTWRDVPVTQVEMKPDLTAKSFSNQNAFFFAVLSKIAYETEDEARRLLVGSPTCSGLGFDQLHWFEGGEEARKYPFDAIHDTEAFVAANNDIIAVVFRGTKTIDNWYTNFMLSPRKCPSEWGVPSPGGEVHQGFDDGVNTVWTGDGGGMGDTIKLLCNAPSKNKRKLYLAGHSLGGALATNAAARLAFVHDIKIDGIYTIGSPRLFDRTAAMHFDTTINHGTPLKDKCFRCKNNSDIVTTVPGSPYIHVGTEIFLDQYGSISMSSMAARFLDGLLWWLRLEFIRGIDDHATSEYVRLFEQVVINSRVPLLDKAACVMMETMGCVAQQMMTEAMQNSEGFKKMRRRRENIEHVKAMAREAARDF